MSSRVLSVIPPNPDGSYTIYTEGNYAVTLTFQPSQNANFRVVSTEQESNLPNGNYTWVTNFGIQNSAGQTMPSVAFHLSATTRTDGKTWYVYYYRQISRNGGWENDPNDHNPIKPLNGDHSNVPGDPPVGYG